MASSAGTPIDFGQHRLKAGGPRELVVGRDRPRPADARVGDNSVLDEARHLATGSGLGRTCATRQVADAQWLDFGGKEDAEEPHLLLGPKKRPERRGHFTHIVDHIIESEHQCD